MIANVVNAIYGFVVAPLCIRYFGKADYGLIALAFSVNSYMQLMDLGLASTNVRFFANWLASGDRDKVNRLMQTCTAFYVIVGLFNAVVLGVVAAFVERIFNVTAAQAEILRMLLVVLAGMAVVNWACSCLGQMISAMENVAWTQKCQVFAKVLMIFVLMLTFSCQLSLVQYVIASQTVALIIIPLNLWKVWHEAPFISFLPRFDWSTFKMILPYSLNIFSFGFFQFLFYQSRTLFLGIRTTPEIVTEYNVIGGIAGLTSIVSGVFLGALLPSASRVVAKGDRENYERVAYQGTKFICVSLAFCGFGLMTIGRDLLFVYVGESFLHLVPWLMLWLFTVVLGSHNQCISSLILAGADIWAITCNTIVSSLIGLVATWLLIPKLGPGGPIVAYLIYVVCQVAFYWFYYWPRKMAISSWRIVSRMFVPYVFLGSVLFGGICALPHLDNHWLNVFLFGGLFAVLFVCGSYLLFDNSDKDFIFGILKRRRR